jgi:hypothetical protein
MPSNHFVKGFVAVTPFFNGPSDKYLFFIVLVMFLVGAVMAIMELRQWWKKQSELDFKPPSRVFILVSSIFAKFKRSPERNSPDQVTQSAETERQRKAA